jgi:hypothetical protein
MAGTQRGRHLVPMAECPSSENDIPQDHRSAGASVTQISSNRSSRAFAGAQWIVGHGSGAAVGRCTSGQRHCPLAPSGSDHISGGKPTCR